MRPPAERFLTRISWSPLAARSLPRRSIDETRSPARRSIGRGTAVERETLVDSNSASPVFWGCVTDFRRISDPNIKLIASNGAKTHFQRETLGATRLRELFLRC